MRIYDKLIFLLYLVHIARTLPFGSEPTSRWRRIKTKRTNTGGGGGIPGAGGGLPTKSRNSFGSLGKRFGGTSSGGFGKNNRKSSNLKLGGGKSGAGNVKTEILTQKEKMANFYSSFLKKFNEEKNTKNSKSSVGGGSAANNQSSSSTGQIGFDDKDFSQLLKNVRDIYGSTKIENNSHRYKKCTKEWLKEKMSTKRRKLDSRTFYSNTEKQIKFRNWFVDLIRVRCGVKISL